MVKVYMAAMMATIDAGSITAGDAEKIKAYNQSVAEAKQTEEEEAANNLPENMELHIICKQSIPIPLHGTVPAIRPNLDVLRYSPIAGDNGQYHIGARFPAASHQKDIFCRRLRWSGG